MLKSACGFLAGLLICSIAMAGEPKVTPDKIILLSPEASQQILVSGADEGNRTIDLTRQAAYRSAAPAIAVVNELGLVSPIRDGATTIIVEVAGRETHVPVEVRGIDRPSPISFPRDILPILTKTGCNSGGCHGKAEGQNGFKLSVFGFDPHGDFEAISQQARGRRVFLSSPERSLLLRKATAVEPHGGGQRMEVGDLRYRRLLRWIAEGATYLVDDAPQIARIEVEPSEQVLLANESQQLRVWAIDSTGERRCVTTEAEYDSNAGNIAGVDGRGFVQASDIAGEAAILVRYLGQVAVSRITIPRPGVEFARPPEHNFIDRLAWNKLDRLGIEPSSLCDDATFLRRAYLDVIGTLPTADESRAFLSDTAKDKRAKLVDALLERPEYADYWTMRFSDLLRVDQTKITPAGAVAITRWLREQFAANRPYDALVGELLTAKGNIQAPGPAAYFKAIDTPELAARSISQTFLGVRIECAQCHHHPSDRWGQEDYFAMAGLVSGIGKKKLPAGGEAIALVVAKDMKHPRTGEVIAPHALGAEPIEFSPGEDRRVYLVDWMTADSNPFFSPMIANRLWAHYFGRGLVEPIDDLRMTNPATNEPLLAELAAHMRAVKYDLKAFTRTLLASRLYQLDSATTAGNADDNQNFSHAAQKSLPAEVLLDASGQATCVPVTFEGWPAGYRAIQIWDSKLPSYFFRIFGRPVRATVCECERSVEPSIAQALHLMNSPEIMEIIRARQGRAAELVAADLPPEKIVDELCLATLARLPSAEERTLLLAAFPNPDNANTDELRAAAEDVLWSLLNSKEFLYNH
jgi:hypothetical protein